MSRGEASQRLKRRGRLGRLLFWAFAIAAIVAVFLIAKCGGGFGLGKGSGGLGKGRSLRGGTEASGAASGAGAGAASTAPARCMVRVDATGIAVNGKPATVAEVVSACKSAAAGADVIVAGDARQATWEELRGALDAAGIASLVRGAGAPVAPDGGAAAPDSGP
jgi:hypothetical protein